MLRAILDAAAFLFTPQEMNDGAEVVGHTVGITTIVSAVGLYALGALSKNSAYTVAGLGACFNAGILTGIPAFFIPPLLTSVAFSALFKNAKPFVGIGVKVS